ncbi:MAG TPA: carboxypeptidase-like regulatory domain-containing protein, partial [Bryobacteraceae bacterium]|nr:carboxypeptidase-like regulatory domain-containing protein [Bryobacteraceae bacterium]
MQLSRVFRRQTLQSAILLVLLYAFPGSAIGQGNTNATILGTVTDSGGAVVPNASVQVKNTGTGQ